MTVLEILQPRLDPLQLKGFRKGCFNDQKDKFFAYSILSVHDKNYDFLNNMFLDNQAHGHRVVGDERKYNVYNQDGTYRGKTVEELIKENIFKFVSLRFYGVLFEEEWFILYEILYHEETNELDVEIDLDKTYLHAAFQSSLFMPIPEYEQQINYNELIRLISKRLNKELNLRKDFSVISEEMKSIPKDEIPKKQIRQYANLREFVGHPWLVGHIKQEQKSKMNRAFENYFNEAVLLPFLKKLRVERFEDFSVLHTLYSPEHFPLIYPDSKEYVIAIVKAVSSDEKSRLYYFVYQDSTKQMFEWTKPPIHEAGGHHSEWILDDIENLSNWGREFDLHEPSITMDDENFWKEHVLKKEHDHYLYLKEYRLGET